MSDALKIFYKELVEITIDFIANNMFFEANPRSTQYADNQSEFFVDIYANTTYSSANANYLRSSSLINHDLVLSSSSSSTANIDTTSGATQQLKANKGQTRQWLVGNKIVQVKTGLFSNICLDDGLAHLGSSSKSKSNSISISQQQQVTTSKIASKLKTAAIDIPATTATNASSLLILNHTNESSMPSSNASSTATSVSNNNSFSSASLNGNFTQAQASIQTGQITRASEKDLFDVALDQQTEKDDNDYAQQQQTISSITAIPVQQIRRSKLKRRYKSGLPLTNNNQNDNDSNEEFNLRQYYDYAMNKQSKDDSGTIRFNFFLYLSLYNT